MLLNDFNPFCEELLVGGVALHHSASISLIQVLETIVAAYLFVDDDLSVSLDDGAKEFFANYAANIKRPVYLIRSPLGDEKYQYDYEGGFLFASPGHRLMFIGTSSELDESFDDYVDDFKDDISHISDKYEYRSVVGRKKAWGEYFGSAPLGDVLVGGGEWFASILMHDVNVSRKADLIISLVTGSINDIQRVGADEPQQLLDKVKQKIILFDADQTRFIFQKVDKKRVVIQGLAGSGKTELLLHKLKELYLLRSEPKIAFTCHNKILASNMRSRIPQFFDFMKVERQIEWQGKLWCMHAWGSSSSPSTGIYSYVCNFYGLPFYSFSQASFDFACTKVIEQITEISGGNEAGVFLHAFDYIFIDESQDFPKSFIDMCELVAREKIFVAGDIFQNIFQANILSANPDFALRKCYRTDPKTLMFAQAFGMGLFESPKIRWLQDDEWAACGYAFDVENDEYIFRRDPLRRFEDIDSSNFQSVVLREIEGSEFVSGISDNVVHIVREIHREHPTLKPDDVAVIFLDKADYIYPAMDKLSFMILNEFGWSSNISHNTKAKIEGQVFLSNINNAKGLEFPFVICVTKSISRSIAYRNAAYTMLSRSFIQSYLVFPKTGNEEIGTVLAAGLNTILEQGVMRVAAPLPLEIEGLTRAIQPIEVMTLEDIVNDFCRERSLSATKKAKLHKWVKTVLEDEYDLSQIRDFLELKYKSI